ncbi:MAG: HAD family phosphatase [Christensenellaceae bacterium]|nr:HAD family phosphatase [Christensenellaceae bacterium]
MYKGIIFDMDGIMFNTEYLAEEGWMRVARETGLPVTRQFIRGFHGHNLNDCNQMFKDEFGPDFDIMHYRAIKTQFVKEYIEENGLPVKKGLFELLDAITAAGIPHTIATSTDRATTLFDLEISGAIRYFDVDRMICGDMVTKSKPDPEIYLKAAALLGLPPTSCIAFEDSPPGIQSAHAAGLGPILVPDMDRPPEDICRLALHELEDLSQAIPLLPTLLSEYF